MVIANMVPHFFSRPVSDR